ncbi:MAG: DUF4382 domain-containing protein [Bacteroidetes bacterium]|nr:DUF4382 domain-containing protein [Bacteroidota bacterium]
MCWLSVGIIAMAASCSNDNTQTATLQVRLTDAPGDYQEVNVDIQDVQINAEAGNSNSGWKSLNVRKGVYNLLKFTNGLDTLLGSIELPVGRVSQIRLVLGSNNAVKIAGQSISLATPSAQQSGLKILVNTDLRAGVTYKITLDFDAASSIVKTGNITYILKPVIHSVVEAESGAIKGMVDPVASTPAVYALSGTDTVETAYADQSTGKFLLKGLSAGNYKVSFAPKSGYLPKSVDNVSVTVGNVTDLGTVKISQ